MNKLFWMILALILVSCSNQEKHGVEVVRENKVKVHTIDLGTIVLEDEAAKKVIEFLEWNEIIDHPDLWVSSRFFKETWEEFDEYTAIHEERINPAKLSETEIDSSYFYSVSFSVSRDKMKYYRKYLVTEDKKYLREYLNIYDPKFMGLRIYGDRKRFKGIEQ
jgi:hypothetical protein